MTLTVAEIMTKLPGAFMPQKAEGVDAVVHFKFTGSEPGEWNAVIENGACVVSQGLPRSKPTISISADSADYIDIVEGRTEPTRAFMEGKIRFTGDAQLALRLLGLFRAP